MKNLILFLLVALMSTAIADDNIHQPQGPRTATVRQHDQPKTYSVDRVMRHGCLIGAIMPLTEQALERKLDHLSSSGRFVTEILQPPSSITLGSMFFGSLTMGVWCPAGYVNVVAHR